MSKCDSSDLEIFVEHLQLQPLSDICYILWYINHQREKIDLAFSIDPLRYIFRFENKYTIMGDKVWKLKEKIRWFKENIVLIFEKRKWEEITKCFDNFRSLENNKPTDSYNTYLSLRLSRDQLSSVNTVNDRIIRIPSPEHTFPKKYRHLKGGLAYGFLKDNRIVSFAAAPHILTTKSNSFAILRGIKTDVHERKHGYALQTVGLLCKELFSKYQVFNIFSWVDESNTPALNLYKKLGFYEDSKVYTTYCDLKK